jgi:hypothetical protein
MTAPVIPTIATWFGASGRGYKFTVSPLPVGGLIAGRNGNFVLARADGPGWAPISIGQGELGVAIPAAAARAQGATHVHWRYTGGGETLRQELDADLRAGHKDAGPA